MAYVSQAGIPSSSSKHVYDGVFGSSKVKSTVFSSFNDDDYGEIFGCSKLDDGGWQSSCCSIPVVELPVSEQRVRGVRGIEMDYGVVLGGFSDEGLSLMNGNELFDQLKKKARTSSPLVSVSRTRSKEQTKEVIGSHIPSHSQNVEPSMDGISKSSDGVKQYKQKTDDMPSGETNSTRHVGHLNSTSGPTCTSHERALLQEVQNSRTPVGKADTQFDHDMSIRETHSRNSSSDLGVNKQKIEHDAGFHKASHETHQFTNQTNGESHEVDSSHKALISETPVIQADIEVEVDINLATKGKHSRHSSSVVGVNEHKSEVDASLQEAHGLSGSNSAATTCTSQPCTIADEVDVEFDVKNNIGVDGFSNSCPTKQNDETHSTSSYQESGLRSSSSAGFDSGKNLRRHSRMTSLDLGRQASDHDGGGGSHRKSRLGSSYSFDASHDPSVARMKVQPSKMIPSSSQPHLFPMENHYKISENSKSGSSLPSLDDQLDMNSLAAISASALQRAIEEAEMQIRLSKEFLEREGRGCAKLRFKDTLKAKVMKENKHVSKIDNVKRKNMVEDHSHVDNVTVTSPFGRESVLETARFVPVVEDHKQFVKESITGENAEAPEFIEEGGKNEAGEWEPTKHLNQLITGVKNKLASFMTWQIETEKKEESKEVESIKQPHSSEYGGCESKGTVENQSVITTANNREIEENITRVAPRHIENEESGSTRSNTTEPEKVGGLVDSTVDSEGSTSANFLFFSFNSRRLRGLSHPEETEKKETRGNSEVESENKQEPVNTVKNEQIQRKGNEANVEIQDNSVSQDYGERLINSFYEECIATIEEHYPMAAHDTNQFTHEEGNDSELSQKANVPGKEEYADDCAVDAGHRHYPVIYEEHGGDRIESKDEEEASDRRVIEEIEDDKSASILEAVNEVNEECESDTDTSFLEADNETSVNEEYASIQEEGYDRTVCEEHGDDRSRSSDEAENRKLTEEHGEEPMDDAQLPENIVVIVEDDNDQDEIEMFEESEDHPDNAQLLENIERASEERFESPVNERDQCATYYIEEVSGQMNEVEEESGYQSKADHVEETTKKDIEQASCMEVVDKCWQMEDVVLSKAEEAVRRIDGGDIGAEIEFDVENGKIIERNDFPSDVEMGAETSASHDEESEEKMEIINHSSEPEIVADHPVFSHTTIDCIQEKRVLMPVFAENSVKFDGFERYNSIDPECETNVSSGPKDFADGEETENDVEFDGIEHHNNIDAAFPCENSVPHECDTDVDRGKNDINDDRETELKSEDILVNETKHLRESGKTSDTWVAASVSDQEAEESNVEGVHRRRRWFENGDTVDAVERPIILEETDSSKSVEAIGEADSVLNQGDDLVNVETTHKRRRWFVKRGEEGFPEPPSLFEGIKVTSQLDHEVANVSVPHQEPDECVSKSKTEADEVVSGEKDKQNVEATPRRKKWFESVENVEPTKNPSDEDDRSGTEKGGQNLDNVPAVEEENDIPNKVEPVNEPERDVDAESRRKKEREKERIAVERAIREVRERAFAEAKERAIREVRERAFAEAKERARRDAAERPPSRVTCQKSGSGEANSSSDKASMEAKIRAERAAVERATAEVRERALQKALSEKASQRSREHSGRYPPERSSSLDPKYSSSSHSRSSDPSNNGDKFDGADGESSQRRKARLERQNRTMERAAKALEEKNTRDLLVQKEQAARNILADALDAEVKRWSTGKEGNVRALLSTLQYILGSDSGWQSVSLTDLVAPTAVRKAYKKATLCVHPDKLQQRGATIQQKYICEKVFDLLKDAWSRFNPEDR